MLVLESLFSPMMANTTFISFINFFILRAVMGAVTPHGLMKDYNHPHLETMPIRQCMLNQFYDSDEGRCLIVLGGGTAVFIDSVARCEKEVLRADLFNKRRYAICRASKTIHAECKDHQIFSRRLKRCIYDVSFSEIIYTQFLHHHHHELPLCEEPGKFPAPEDRQIFYTCTSNGFRLYRDIYSCPHSTAYNPHIQMCIDGDSYATGGFSTTEFPIKFISIMPKTTNKKEDPSQNSLDDTRSTIANEIFNSEETLQAVSIIPKELEKENFLQKYFASTTEMSNLDVQAYEQNTTVSSLLEMTCTENILSNITPVAIDTTNLSNEIVSHSKGTTMILPELYGFENEHSTLETFCETATEVPNVTEKILNEEQQPILFENDDSNYGNIENEDSTKIFLKFTTEIVTEPISHTSTMNADNRGNYLEATASDAIIISIETDNASNIPSTTPAAVRKVTLVEEIPVEELTVSYFQIDPTTESQSHEFLHYPSEIYTSSVIPEISSSSTTELTIADISSLSQSDAMLDNTSPLYSTTERTK